MEWTEKHIKGLAAAGKIRGYSVTNQGKNIPNNIPKPKPRSIIWLDLNLQYWCNEHLLTLEKEYQFCPDRKYRSDYAIPAKKILIEYEGGIFMKRSGHNSHTGIQRDIEKYSLAHQLGYTVIRLTAKSYKKVLQQLNELLK